MGYARRGPVRAVLARVCSDTSDDVEAVAPRGELCPDRSRGGRSPRQRDKSRQRQGARLPTARHAVNCLFSSQLTPLWSSRALPSLQSLQTITVAIAP